MPFSFVLPATNRCVQSGNTTFIPDLAAYSFLSGKLSDMRSAEDPCPATIARASGRDEKLRVDRMATNPAFAPCIELRHEVGSSAEQSPALTGAWQRPSRASATTECERAE